jgi:hypothetical protein
VVYVADFGSFTDSQAVVALQEIDSGVNTL